MNDFWIQQGDVGASRVRATDLDLADWPLVLATVIEKVTRHDVRVWGVTLTSTTDDAPEVGVQLADGEDPVDAVASEFRAGPPEPLTFNYTRSGAVVGERDGELWSARVRLYSGRTRPGSQCGCKTCECDS